MKRLRTVLFVLAGFVGGVAFVYSCGGGSSSNSGNLTWPSPVPVTGQTSSYAGSDDGTLRAGLAWPNPRFTDNSDGTVTDNLTGLVWLQNANCFGGKFWSDALAEANQLANGACGLTDGSTAGEWRLPNIRELLSLVHYGYEMPPLSNTAGSGKYSSGDPFIGVQEFEYWSGTHFQYNGLAWYVQFICGRASMEGYDHYYYVWPVRDSA